ncbi:MAG: DUF1540 domain-containing protein [Chitinispirillaceae bacterium]
MAEQMSKIFDCEATECIYNKNKQCHTPGITVGDEEPLCDTFKSAASKGGREEIIGGVGACKVANCKYNDSFECSAKGIHIIMKNGHADCGTFQPR